MVLRFSNFPAYAIHLFANGFSLCKSQEPEKYICKNYKNASFPTLERECGIFFDELTEKDEVAVYLDAPTPLLIPKEIYSEPASEYLRVQSEPTAFDTILEDEINEEYVALFPYGISKIAQLQTLVNCKVSLHHIDQYIVQCLQNMKCQLKYQLAVYFSDEKIECILLNDSKLHLINGFKYTTAEDVLYYLLNLMQQFSISTQNCEIFFAGTILEDKKMGKFLQPYIPNWKELNI